MSSSEGTYKLAKIMHFDSQVQRLTRDVEKLMGIAAQHGAKIKELVQQVGKSVTQVEFMSAITTTRFQNLNVVKSMQQDKDRENDANANLADGLSLFNDSKDGEIKQLKSQCAQLEKDLFESNFKLEMTAKKMEHEVKLSRKDVYDLRKYIAALENKLEQFAHAVEDSGIETHVTFVNKSNAMSENAQRRPSFLLSVTEDSSAHGGVLSDGSSSEEPNYAIRITDEDVDDELVNAFVHVQERSSEHQNALDRSEVTRSAHDHSRRTEVRPSTRSPSPENLSGSAMSAVTVRSDTTHMTADTATKHHSTDHTTTIHQTAAPAAHRTSQPPRIRKPQSGFVRGARHYLASIDDEDTPPTGDIPAQSNISHAAVPEDFVGETIERVRQQCFQVVQQFNAIRTVEEIARHMASSAVGNVEDRFAKLEAEKAASLSSHQTASEQHQKQQSVRPSKHFFPEDSLTVLPSQVLENLTALSEMTKQRQQQQQPQSNNRKGKRVSGIISLKGAAEDAVLDTLAEAGVADDGPETSSSIKQPGFSSRKSFTVQKDRDSPRTQSSAMTSAHSSSKVPFSPKTIEEKDSRRSSRIQLDSPRKASVIGTIKEDTTMGSRLDEDSLTTSGRRSTKRASVSAKLEQINKDILDEISVDSPIPTPRSPPALLSIGDSEFESFSTVEPLSLVSMDDIPIEKPKDDVVLQYIDEKLRRFVVQVNLRLETIDEHNSVLNDNCNTLLQKISTVQHHHNMVVAKVESVQTSQKALIKRLAQVSDNQRLVMHPLVSSMEELEQDMEQFEQSMEQITAEMMNVKKDVKFHLTEAKTATVKKSLKDNIDATKLSHFLPESGFGDSEELIVHLRHYETLFADLHDKYEFILSQLGIFVQADTKKFQLMPRSAKEKITELLSAHKQHGGVGLSNNNNKIAVSSAGRNISTADNRNVSSANEGFKFSDTIDLEQCSAVDKLKEQFLSLRGEIDVMKGAIHSCSEMLNKSFVDERKTKPPDQKSFESSGLRSPVKNRRLVQIDIDDIPMRKVISPNVVPSLMNGKFLTRSVREEKSSLEEIELKLRAENLLSEKERLASRGMAGPPVLSSAAGKSARHPPPTPLQLPNLESPSVAPIDPAHYKSIWQSDFGPLFSQNSDEAQQ